MRFLQLIENNKFFPASWGLGSVSLQKATRLQFAVTDFSGDLKTSFTTKTCRSQFEHFNRWPILLFATKTKQIDPFSIKESNSA